MGRARATEAVAIAANRVLKFIVKRELVRSGRVTRTCWLDKTNVELRFMYVSNGLL